MIGNIKHIFIIESLFDEDIKSGLELYDDVVKRRIDGLQKAEIKMTHSFFDAKNKVSLIEYLKYVTVNSVAMQAGILLHLEIHGSLDKNGLILKDKSLITWLELVEIFREINTSSSNALYISLASCFG